MMTEHKKRILDLLTALGESADAVSKSLSKMNMIGDMGKAASDPVAKYLNHISAIMGDNEYHRVSWSEKHNYVQVCSGQLYYQYSLAENEKLVGVRNFMRNFDKGQYPSLVRTET